eukprot:scaffold7774_cov93-Isochrysis_galbana.AAC.2
MQPSTRSTRPLRCSSAYASGDGAAGSCIACSSSVDTYARTSASNAAASSKRIVAGTGDTHCDDRQDGRSPPSCSICAGAAQASKIATTERRRMTASQRHKIRSPGLKYKRISRARAGRTLLFFLLTFLRSHHNQKQERTPAQDTQALCTQVASHTPKRYRHTTLYNSSIDH